MSKAVKIGFVVPGAYVYFNQSVPWPPGGSEKQAFELARALALDSRLEVHACVADFGQPVLERREGVHLHRANAYRDPPLRALIRLAQALRRTDADVYVFRSPGVGVALGILLAACWRRRPVLYMLAHDAETEAPRLRRWIGWPGAWLMGRAYGLARRICAQSEQQRRDFEQHRARPVAAVIRNVHVAPGGLPAPDAGRRMVLWVGRALPWKRGEAFLELARRFPGTPFRMVCTPADPECLARLRTLSGDLPNVEWRESVPPAGMAAMYREAVIFVSTSSGEGFPNTMLEAMANGCAILSATVDPDGLLAKHGAGVCVHTEDADALATALGPLLRDVEASRRLGANGAEYVRRFHSPEVVVPQLAELLLGLARAGR